KNNASIMWNWPRFLLDDPFIPSFRSRRRSDTADFRGDPDRLGFRFGHISGAHGGSGCLSPVRRRMDADRPGFVDDSGRAALPRSLFQHSRAIARRAASAALSGDRYRLSIAGSYQLCRPVHARADSRDGAGELYFRTGNLWMADFL